MKKLIFFVLSTGFLVSCGNQSTTTDAPTVAPETPAETKVAPVEISEARYVDLGKNSLASMSKGDMQGWSTNWADNIVWQFNTGDSIVGKVAVLDYWTKRRTGVIDSISFSNEVWLPVKVNQPQDIEKTGVWLLGWYRVSSKYKNGKSMSQFIHTVNILMKPIR